MIGRQYRIVGFMVRADYLAMLKEATDSFANYERFGMAVINRAAVEEAEEHSEYYSVRYSADSSVEFRRDLNADHHILSYTVSSGNMRINSALNQSKLIFSIALVVVPVLYIIVLLLISLMLKRRLKSEQRQIGTLVALGYRKSEIFRHYSIYALIPAVIGGVIGVIGGYFAAFPFSAFYFGYFESVPYTVKADVVTVIVILTAPLLLYTLAAYFTVSKVLKKTPVEMLRQTEKSPGHSSRALVGKDISFRTKYRIRSVVMHKSRSVVIVVGMIISTVCVLIGWCIKDSVDTLVNHSIDSIPYEYACILNKTETEVPGDAEGALVAGYETESSSVGFTMFGYQENSRFINMKTLDGDDMEYGKYYITYAASAAYGVGKGGQLVFRDLITAEEYSVTIAGVIDDNTSTTVYTSIENTAGFSGYEAGQYNMFMSEKELDPDENTVISTTSREDSRKAIESVTDMYYSVCYMVTLVGFLLGVLSMYLLTSMIIEENTVNISMLKILGYRKNEISRLILMTNTVLVLTGFLLGIPVTLLFGRQVFASSVEIVGMFFPMTLLPVSYLIAFAVIALAYIVSLLLSSRKVGKITMTESLKRNNE